MKRGGGRFVRIELPNLVLRKGHHHREKPYHIVGRDEESAAKSIEEFTKANGQILLPLVELITQARVAVDEVITPSAAKPSKRF